METLATEQQTKELTFDQARKQYLRYCAKKGVILNEPSELLSNQNSNGSWILRNSNGTLGVVDQEFQSLEEIGNTEQLIQSNFENHLGETLEGIFGEFLKTKAIELTEKLFLSGYPTAEIPEKLDQQLDEIIQDRINKIEEVLS